MTTPPYARRHQHIEEAPDEQSVETVVPTLTEEEIASPQRNSFERWEQEQPEVALYDAMKSLHRPRTEDNARLKKLSKYSAIHDALSLLGQTYAASKGADVRAYDQKTTHSFLNRYRQRVEEDENREHEARLRELQQKIRMMGTYRGEKQAEQEHFRQVQRDTANRYHQREMAGQQQQWREEGEERTRQFTREENAANRALQRELAKLKEGNRPPGAFDREQWRRQNWMQLQSRDGRPITDMTEDQSVALYAFIINRMRETGQISDELYRTTYSVERVDPVQIKRIINEHWDKFDETRDFVNTVRSGRPGQAPSAASDPLGLFDNNNPLGLDL